MYLKWSSAAKSSFVVVVFLRFLFSLIMHVDIDECAKDGLHNCGPGTSICENIPGSFLYICKVGFTYDETQCEVKCDTSNNFSCHYFIISKFVFFFLVLFPIYLLLPFFSLSITCQKLFTEEPRFNESLHNYFLVFPVPVIVT